MHQEAAQALRAGFDDYHARFRSITQRAQRRFENRDWNGAGADAVERIELYDVCIGEMAGRIEALLGESLADRQQWRLIRDAYAVTIGNLLDQELYKTWFNTLTRRFFRIRGVDAAIEFVALDIEPTDRITHPVSRHSYAVWSNLARVCQAVLDDYPFATAYAHAGLCAMRIAEAISRRLEHWGSDPVRAIELMETVFYRERRAYLVGRVFGVDRIAPLVIALVNEPGGIRADAVLTEREHVAQVFGYARSYFHADLATVGDAVVFLRTLLPSKPIDELYTVLGRAKQGKTERFRHFFRHMARDPDEPLIHAEGERGMVMLVFTLPSYPLVFKLIRDRFAFPKESVRDEVMAKYRLVFHHDRAGRLVDAQEFRFLRFPKMRFDAPLLAEILAECRESAYVDGTDLVISHCYIERRLRPLNLYIREAEADLVRRAVLDYGQSIKDLARSNVFPGDLLLKNFGITRNGRAIFYDYDELCLVEQCRFRAMPDDDDEGRPHGEAMYVGPHDVFPEQFPRFLGLREDHLALLRQVHGDIFDVRWWLDLQRQLSQGERPDVPPYPESTRLETQVMLGTQL
ncbi:bifunctional isocitrate dehydrogenase kinase/phosphatase [Tahibacter amnicola]|uniref:Isocitrate dehydrogenase kinase/phosphatase n=1 Tax=Tahibacter amnicola TaxID=2976241 RepID=A0ABY6BID0_9GAMM|nr:bifunctional isocitrate dehydrogenase kinase/phosphatase [Tahibacter amnicola]UXI68125.1 bifunctional isocitrate dehydrogenase kinase/phosphatase [Tahibacter amnicola]